MKKKRIIVCLLLIIYMLLYVGIKYIHRNDNKELSSYDKYLKMNEFVAKEEGNETKEEPEAEKATNGEINTNAAVINKAELLKVVDTDKMLLIGDKITNSINDISSIAKESKNFDLETYFNNNSEYIYYLFGINEVDNFKTCWGKISKLLDSGKQFSINEVCIVEGSLINDENGMPKFALKIKNSTTEENFTIYIKEVTNDNVTLVWE